MVLISIKESGCERVLRALALTEAAEIRLDFCDLLPEEIRQIFESEKTLIATCRPSALISPEKCEEILGYALDGMGKSSVKANKYIDLDIETNDIIVDRISNKIKDVGAKLICSYHNFERTPQQEELESTVNQLFGKGHIAKLVTMANSTEDAVKVMNLYKQFDSSKLLAFCMGEPGKFTRRLSTELGSPWSYTALDANSATAPGQFTFEELGKISKSSFFAHKIDFRKIKSAIYTPASKSHLQRVIVASCLSRGVTTIDNFTLCNDSQAAINLFESLGVEFEVINSGSEKGSSLIIRSRGIEGLREHIGNRENEVISMQTGESGLLTRLMIPVAAALIYGQSKSVIISGKGTILNREFAESREVLTQLGYDVKLENNKLPIVIKHNTALKMYREITISGREGSQLISGLLMALPLLNDSFSLTVEKPSSTPYIDTTIGTLDSFGIQIFNESYKHYKIQGKNCYNSPGRISVDGDWSGASVLLATAAFTEGTELFNLKMNSGQADEKIFGILLSCGADASFDSENSSVTIKKSAQKLKAFEFDATDSPDLFPALAVLAVN
jgi:3-phosphoshikimate 1-carboxyvinyltransferase